MDRFLSNAINNVDKKGRVSIPAAFRTLLEKRKETQLYTLQSIDMPTIDAVGPDLLIAYEKRMADLDPLTSEAPSFKCGNRKNLPHIAARRGPEYCI